MTVRTIIDWLNANSGAVLGIVTTVYAIFTVLLWMATRRQAEMTRQIFEATHRPELAVHPCLRFAANPGFVRLDFELMNHGSTTATVTDWNARIRQGDAVLAASDDFAGPLCVFPQGKEDGRPVEVAGQSAAAVWNGNPAVILEVSVGYRGSNPVATYSTRLRARLRIAGQQDFRLEDVRHEVR
jgi:hypothetical protein